MALIKVKKAMPLCCCLTLLSVVQCIGQFKEKKSPLILEPSKHRNVRMESPLLLEPLKHQDVQKESPLLLELSKSQDIQNKSPLMLEPSKHQEVQKESSLLLEPSKSQDVQKNSPLMLNPSKHQDAQKESSLLLKPSKSQDIQKNSPLMLEPSKHQDIVHSSCSVSDVQPPGPTGRSWARSTWPGGKVHYKISKDIPEDHKQRIRDAMVAISDVSCVTFKSWGVRVRRRAHVLFTNGGNVCFAPVGYAMGKERKIILGTGCMV